jgi:hypothetical protein
MAYCDVWWGHHRVNFTWEYRGSSVDDGSVTLIKCRVNVGYVPLGLCRLTAFIFWTRVWCVYLHVTTIPIARQRLGNTLPREPTRATIGRLLLGSGSANKPSKQRAVFSAWSVQRGYKGTEKVVWEWVVVKWRVEFREPSLPGAEELNWVESLELAVVQ